ncbi:MAG: DUF3786 domain-containing protein [Thermodesulfobacteriota bacterium]|nr:DUF3786 domain-containing protein [Thermodesulfobacteriota bacterium]
MQERRRKSSSSKTPSGKHLEVPIQYWDDIIKKNRDEMCRNALTIQHPQGLLLPFLKEYLLIDITNKCLFRQSGNQLQRIKNPLLQLLCLVYLLNAESESLYDEMISVHEFKTAHFFKGPHELKIRPILDRFGNDLSGFKRAAEAIGGDAVDMADMGYKFSAFPKVPLYYLLWKGDQEFGPSASILFDRSVEHHLKADAIWGLTQLISDALLMGDISTVFQRSSQEVSIQK